MILAVECELIVHVSFPFEDESAEDTLLPYYTGFSEEFAAAGLGECGPPLILLPSTVKSTEGFEMFIPGAFKFDCNVALSQAESALGRIRESLTDMNPKPDLSVKLYGSGRHSRINLYPHNDIENYLSGT